MDSDIIRQAITKSEVSYEILKEKILSMELPPGQKIVISKIAKELKVSDTPIREALNKLQSENLVEMQPHVGYRVAKVTNKKVQENLEIKYELEVVAIRKVADAITPALIAQAEKALNGLSALNDKKDYIGYFKAARKYSLMLYRYNGNQTLCDMIEQLFDLTEPLGIISVAVPNWCDYSLKYHRDILEALKAKDKETAAVLLRKLKIDGLQMLMKGIQ